MADRLPLAWWYAALGVLPPYPCPCGYHVAASYEVSPDGRALVHASEPSQGRRGFACGEAGLIFLCPGLLRKRPASAGVPRRNMPPTHERGVSAPRAAMTQRVLRPPREEVTPNAYR